SRRRHTRFDCDWSSDVCSSDLTSKNQDSAAIRAHALDLARKAVADPGADYRSYLWLGLVAGAAEQSQEAEKALRKAREMKPDAEIGRASCRERGEFRGAPRRI